MCPETVFGVIATYHREPTCPEVVSALIRRIRESMTAK